MADIDFLRQNLEALKGLRDQDAEKLASNTLDLIHMYSDVRVSKVVTDRALLGNAEIRQRVIELDLIIHHATIELMRLEREDRKAGYGQS